MPIPGYSPISFLSISPALAFNISTSFYKTLTFSCFSFLANAICALSSYFSPLCILVLSTNAITLPEYVVINISYLLPLVMNPASRPVIDSCNLVSNLSIGTGDLCSYAYISTLPSSLATMKLWYCDVSF